MDKLNIALCGVEDNAARIAWLERKASETEKALPRVHNGVIDGAVTSFGEVPRGIAIVVFSGGAATLALDGVRIAEGASLVAAEISGRGTLTLEPAVSGACAIVFER